VIADDGSFTSVAGPDNTAKIIKVKGTISLSTNKAGTELTEVDYLCAVDGSTVKVKYNFADYVAANDQNVVANQGKLASGDQETARACAVNKQKAIVKIKLGSNTSLIGADATAKIVHGNLSLSTGYDNIVIRNITFEDSFDFFPQWDGTDSSGASNGYPGRWNSQYDLISVEGATRVWIDHNTFTDGSNYDKKYPPIPTWPNGLPEQKVQHHDGLVDINGTADKVTLSYNHFKDHDKTGLVGGTDTAKLTSDNPNLFSVTYHHNLYENTVQRQPRVRFGKVHLYNNYYTGMLPNADKSMPNYGWMVAWTVGTAGKLYVENNVLEIIPSVDGTQATLSNAVGISTSNSNKTKCTSVANKTWTDADCVSYFYDSGNLFNGQATATYDFWNAIQTQVAASSSSAAVAKTDTYWKPSSSYSYTPDVVTTVKSTLLKSAGVGKL